MSKKMSSGQIFLNLNTEAIVKSLLIKWKNTQQWSRWN